MRLLLVLLFFSSALWARADNCAQPVLRNTVDGDALWRDLTAIASDEMLGRKTETDGSDKAQAYITGRFKEMGAGFFEEGYRHPFTWPLTFGQQSGTNIIAWLPGTGPSSQYIVITAHYDHLGKQGRKIFNGADDNASGVAGMLAIARLVKDNPLKLGVIFVATDAEEKGLYGARAFLKTPPVPLADIRFNLNLDMIANGGRRHRLYLSASRDNELLSSVVSQSVEWAGLCLGEGHNGVTRSFDGNSRINWLKASDHYPFYQQGIPFLFFSVSDHRFYHTHQDTTERISRTFYQASVEAIWYTLMVLDRSA